MVNVIMMDMKKSTTKPNLLGGEEENTPQEKTPSSPMSIGQFLDEMGVD